MANMSPQRDLLNRKFWQFLERQVLTWAVDEGPLYVVTGTAFRRFPHQRFEVFTNGTFDSSQIYRTDFILLKAAEQHHINHSSHPPGDRKSTRLNSSH